MTLFSGFPTYNRYTALRLTDPYTRNEAVYALQSGLAIEADGIFGKQTDAAVKAFQKNAFLTVDGVAGPATQSALAKQFEVAASDENALPYGLLLGQLTHESGLVLGNYSPQRADGSYDAGVAQRNTAHTPARDGFNVPESITALAENTATYFKKFSGVPSRRRWELAAGAWNAPAYACFIANEEGASVRKSETKAPGPTARKTLEGYITAVTALMT